jgi:hypothetical protein
MLRFLELLAPKSSAVKAFRKAQKKRMDEWRKRRASERAAGVAFPTSNPSTAEKGHTAALSDGANVRKP